MKIISLFILALCSCRNPSNFTKESILTNTDSVKNKPVNFNSDSVSSINITTKNGLIKIDLCHLNKIRSVFPKQSQKIYSTDLEGSEGFQLLIKLNNNQWISLESTDSNFNYISRVSTNSPLMTTNNGYKVGIKIVTIKMPVIMMEDLNDKSFEIKNSNLGFKIDLDKKINFLRLKKFQLINQV